MEAASSYLSRGNVTKSRWNPAAATDRIEASTREWRNWQTRKT
jgi:hypothetical protein